MWIVADLQQIKFHILEFSGIKKKTNPSVWLNLRMQNPPMQSVNWTHFQVEAMRDSPSLSIVFQVWMCTSTFLWRLEEKVYLHVISNTNGEGNGTPLQYSCLENPMDRGAW